MTLIAMILFFPEIPLSRYRLNRHDVCMPNACHKFQRKFQATSLLMRASLSLEDYLAGERLKHRIHPVADSITRNSARCCDPRCPVVLWPGSFYTRYNAGLGPVRAKMVRARFERYFFDGGGRRRTKGKGTKGERAGAIAREPP